MGAIPPPDMIDTIEQGSYWPYTKPPGMNKEGDGDWTLWMDAAACMCIAPAGDTIPDDMGFIRVYNASREQLKQFLRMFCALGHDTDERLVHQDGRIWLFNWRSFSLAQVRVAALVADRFCAGDIDGAWSAGHAFGDQINAAVQEHYAARNNT